MVFDDSTVGLINPAFDKYPIESEKGGVVIFTPPFHQ